MYQSPELLEKSLINFITLKQAKKYLHVDHDQDNQLIEEMIETALVSAENYIGLNLRQASFKISLFNRLPSIIKIIHRPISAISQFKITKPNGEVIHLTKNNYILESENIKLGHYYAIKKAEITYQTGYSQDQLPAPIKHGMLEHIAKLYDLRGTDQILPLSSKSMYQAYRYTRF